MTALKQNGTLLGFKNPLVKQKDSTCDEFENYTETDFQLCTELLGLCLSNVHSIFMYCRTSWCGQISL